MSETISSKTYIDAHCHLADPKFGSDLDNVLTSSIQSGVGEWIQGGISPDDWLRQQEIRKLWPTRIHLAFGLH
ncbi:MAG: TatD family deoxyribonuclease, partial [Proteobacteria bacterium]|nr:TatD family deoxyribonuclease [Pseudomonadota bacterium]